MEDASEKPEASTPWVWIGESAKYEDCVIGNRTGLEILRGKIDEALANGVAPLPTEILKCKRVQVVETPSNPEWIPDKHRPLKNVIGFTGCAIIVFAVLVIFVAGVGAIVGWWK